MNSWLPPHCINRVWRYAPIIPTSKRLAWAIRDPQKKRKKEGEGELSKGASRESNEEQNRPEKKSSCVIIAEIMGQEVWE